MPRQSRKKSSTGIYHVMLRGINKQDIFEEGYCQAERYVYDASQDEFTFCYYDRDHLGNIRQVTEADGTSTGNVIQTMNYYPFGAEFCDGTANSSVQPYKYNGKEFDVMHGLNTYDYGARQYNPVTAHWDRVDPLAEKYYGISPYAYCGNNPIRFIDPDGRDGMLTGTGTKEDPYIITAIYFYQNGSLGNEQIEGLNSAIDSYNSLGGKYGIKIKNEDGTTSYIKYNLSAVGVDDIERSRSETGFETASGEYRYYGNKVGTNPDGGDEFGSGNNNRIDFNIENIKNGICDYGMSPKELNKGIAIHEIGHNLGGEHADGTSVMRTVQTFISTNYTYTCYPSVSKDFTRIIFRRHDTHKRDGSDGRIWSKK